MGKRQKKQKCDMKNEIETKPNKKKNDEENNEEHKFRRINLTNFVFLN